MKFTAQRERLLKPLQVLSAIVEKRKSLPILSNIYFKLTENTLVLVATDLEVEVLARVVVDSVSQAGETTIPARKLLDICRAFPEQSLIEFSEEANRVLIKVGSSRFNLITQKATDFPRLAEEAGLVEFNIQPKELRFLIENTQFSVAQQDSRKYLTGLLFELSNNQLITVGADGHRMSCATLSPAFKGQQTNHRLVIPRKSINEVLKILEVDDEKITITMGAKQVRFLATNIMFTANVLDAQFPDYKTVLPRRGDKCVIVDRELLKKLFLRASILSDERFNGVSLQLRQGLLKILANNSEQEEVEDQLSIDYDGADLDVGVNVMYLIDVLNHTYTEKVKLTFSGAKEGVIIEELDNERLLFVVMPMHL